jgi:predicted amidohydrolase
MRTDLLTVAAIQMVSTADIDANLRAAAALLRTAAESGARLVVLPENFAVFGGHNLRDIGDRELTSAGPLRGFLAEQARRHGIWLVGGTLPCSAADSRGRLPEPGKVFTSCFVYDGQGVERGRYNKVHLFDVEVADGQGSYRESDQFSPGQDAVVVDTPWGGLGLSICYDLRFPEYYRALLGMGARLLTVPAAFTYTTGAAHWEVLLRARAIENQCAVIAAGQGGVNSARRQTWGDSCVISPWGVKLASQPQGEGVVRATLNLAELDEIRRNMPVQSHRRF